MLHKKISIKWLSVAQELYAKMNTLERAVLYILVSVLLISGIFTILGLRNSITTVTPVSGGTITEGVVGAPRFINPVLAISQTDKDLVELVYSGLMKVAPDGSLQNDLANSVKISDDGKEYTFTLKKNLKFSDGTPLTADDVIFTVNKALQPDIKSPERANWEGVKMEKVDDLTIKFKLDKPYAQFMQNTTLGILPQEHWSKLSADEFVFSNLNLSPIGSGPYKINGMTHNSSGMPESISMVVNNSHVDKTPFISNFNINFYPNSKEELVALQKGVISSARDITPQAFSKIMNHNNLAVHKTALSRIFAVFFNASHNKLLADKSLRAILRDVIDKDKLIKQNLYGQASIVNSPILAKDEIIQTSTLTIKDARTKLEKLGWKQDKDTGIYTKDKTPLALTLTTVNSTELKSVAEFIAQTWRNIGADVKVEVFEPGDLTQNILRTRSYDALLFGEVLNTDPDLYAFWHSSQRQDPGLNIAGYSNTKVDKLLVEIRKTTDKQKRDKLRAEVAKKITEDIPAIFLYSPNFLYITDKSIKNIKLPPVIEPQERFSNITDWYIKTGRKLEIFNN